MTKKESAEMAYILLRARQKEARKIKRLGLIFVK
jgi:hypothetical protein